MKSQRKVPHFHIFIFKGCRKNEEKSTRLDLCVKMWDGLLETACVPVTFVFDVLLIAGDGEQMEGWMILDVF